MQFLLILTLCFFGLTAGPQTNSTVMQKYIDNDTAEVHAVVQQLAKFMISRDTAGMSRILDKDFTLTHITGYVQPKSEWLNEVSRESMKYYSTKEINHAIKVNGASAEVLIQILVDARIWGSRNTWRLQQKMKLEKLGEVWIIKNSIASTF